MNASPGEFIDQLLKGVRALDEGFDPAAVSDQLNLNILIPQISQQILDIPEHLFGAAFAGLVEMKEHAIFLHRNFFKGHGGLASNVCFRNYTAVPLRVVFHLDGVAGSAEQGGFRMQDDMHRHLFQDL